ncbi:MAG: cobalamin-independent methionine synthase II family protein [Chloroflexota bacterium]|nr:cobalamin-independent methionine synthase II family protein [Dehalococcoidia bacterium]MDW8253723.1 cobalamin-independent methionine synthase II family protein [Chloroflexota bacterium]
MADLALTAQLVGSYAKPQWLADHERAYALDEPWWRVPEEFLDQAKTDAALLAIRDQERAGLAVITDGEQRRQSFTAYFFRLHGIDTTRWGPRTSGAASDIAGFVERRAPTARTALFPSLGPTVVGPIAWAGPISVDDLRFLRRSTRRLTKATIAGPATLALRLSDQWYGDLTRLILALADALNREIKALEAAGADIIQLDEPEVHFSLSLVRDAATEAIDRALHGVTARTAVHLCYGYARTTTAKRVNPRYAEAIALIAASRADEISLEYEQPGHQPDVLVHCGRKAVILGLLNNAPDAPVETVDHILARARAALEVVPPERLRLAPDCGMWFLPRAQAFRKISALALAARALRNEFATA